MDAQTHTPSTPTGVDADGIPIHAGTTPSECCCVDPGQPHTLSCENVTPAQALAFINRR
ncbi:hypothetical protein ACGFIW_01465 [Micromonospora sp. NPDC048935]|uniref:hypothetical protein n=1 Tax=Micromonospora sp. NPDC048935 TaxID=3364262 RepID=UPI00371136D5